jgi:hypothetical protein
MIEKDPKSDASKFAKFIFEKTGLIHSLKAITTEIEQEFRGQYSEEDMNSLGNMYDDYYIIKNGDFSYHLENLLTEEQKEFCRLFTRENSLKLSVTRENGTLYSFEEFLQIPILINTPNSPTIELEIELRCNRVGSVIYEVYGEASETSNEDINKIHMNFAFKYG